MIAETARPARSEGPVADSVTVAGWTLVSRVTGLLRVIVIGATLGPTFFANVFQATNLVPNTFFTVLAGWLLTTLLVPVLVDAIDGEGIGRAGVIVRGFLGVVVAAFTAAAAAVLLLGPLIARALTFGIDDPVDAAAARRQVWILLLLVLPQIPLYAVAAIGGAAQNACGRFGLAAAASTVENLGMIVTLVLAARWYGVGRDGVEVDTAHVVLLGLGTTLAVAAHAALQLVGAARVGLRLVPGWGWRDDSVRRIVRRTVPSLATGALDGAWFFGLTMASGAVPGGVVAFQAAFNFYNVPIALGARSVGTATLPRLARLSAHGDLGGFRDEYQRALGLTWLLAVPAGVTVLCLAGPFAHAIAFGELATARGIDLLTAAIAPVGVALVAASTFELARYTAFARVDVRTPVRAGGVRVGTTLLLVGLVVAAADGPGLLVGLGAAMAIGDLAGATVAHRAVRRPLPAEGWDLAGRLGPAVASAVLMAVPAVLAAWLVPSLVGGRAGAVLALAAGAVGGLAVYGVVQLGLDSPDARAVLPARRRRDPVPAGEPV